MTDVFSKEKRSEVMSRIKGKWTTPEMVMHGHLKSRKIQHKMHPRMAGNPDILITGTRTVVFIDGDFWHGKEYAKRKHKLKPFWKAKIETNMKRDKRYGKVLKEDGWRVLRFWEGDVLKRPDWCIERVKAYK